MSRTHPAWAAGSSGFVGGAPEQRRVVFVHLDEIDETLDAEVGESQDAVFADTVDLDDSALGLHFCGDIEQPIFVFAKLLGDEIERLDAGYLVGVHGQAASAEMATARGRQFQGNSSSSR